MRTMWGESCSVRSTARFTWGRVLRDADDVAGKDVM
jgi:hypothetical protein